MSIGHASQSGTLHRCQVRLVPWIGLEAHAQPNLMVDWQAASLVKVLRLGEPVGVVVIPVRPELHLHPLHVFNQVPTRLYRAKCVSVCVCVCMVCVCACVHMCVCDRTPSSSTPRTPPGSHMTQQSSQSVCVCVCVCVCMHSTRFLHDSTEQ